MPSLIACRVSIVFFSCRVIELNRPVHSRRAVGTDWVLRPNQSLLFIDARRLISTVMHSIRRSTDNAHGGKLTGTAAELIGPLITIFCIATIGYMHDRHFTCVQELTSSQLNQQIYEVKIVRIK